jgi:hypothetical protein
MPRRGAFALALDRALESADLTGSDQAMVTLARKYAAALDKNAAALTVYGRVYRETLAELGMSPKARASISGGATAQKPEKSPIDELRERRQQRVAR